MAEKRYTLAEDEKATMVMVYTMNSLSWGSLITKELVRVNTFLRTLTPDYVSLYDARVVPLSGGNPRQPLAFRELHIRTPQVVAFHLMPPASEPPDYDPNEPNRKMEPVTVIVGPWRFDGTLRTSTVTDLGKHLEITTQTFISLYEATISCPGLPTMGAVRTPMVILRRDDSMCGAAP